MNRRDFLALRTGQPALLSCERLYMRYLDSQIDGTTPQFFDRLAGDLRGVSTVRLTQTSWLARADLKAQLEAVLDAFKAGGGRIDR
jgi:hypothetical protein